MLHSWEVTVPLFIEKIPENRHWQRCSLKPTDDLKGTHGFD
jgi:hypothetical protein